MRILDNKSEVNIMIRDLRANLWLLGLTLILCPMLYPAVLLGIGRTMFPNQAEGSFIRNSQGRIIGSRLEAQPFTGEQYFHPRPSAAAYNGAASAATNWGANNYLLRDRVARALGPIVKYQSGPKKGQLAAADIEEWFRQDRYQGNSGIVSQWATAHPTLAANWVKADPLNAAYVTAWREAHPAEFARWKSANPENADPKPKDLAVAFFAEFSKEHPGKFPGSVTADNSATSIQPIDAGTEIQATFFDMWRNDHPDADLEPVPADMVMASASGLDPHITLRSALYQLDRVAAKRAAETGQDVAVVRQKIEKLLHGNVSAPLAGIAGVPCVNVLEINLLLDK